MLPEKQLQPPGSLKKLLPEKFLLPPANLRCSPPNDFRLPKTSSLSQEFETSRVKKEDRDEGFNLEPNKKRLQRTGAGSKNLRDSLTQGQARTQQKRTKGYL